MHSTGYGPSGRLLFNGEEENYKIWEMKFLAYMRTKELRNAIDPDATGIVAVASRERAFAELVQVLDDRSLNLIMSDAEGDAKTAMLILRDHYAGTSEQRILSLLTVLTTISKGHDELLTDYVIRAENAANSLRSAGEVVSDRLLNAVVLKGLPKEYRPFRVFMEQMKRTTSFLEFKKALRSFEENEKAALGNVSTQMESVMKLQTNDRAREDNCNPRDEKIVTCYSCGGHGHKSIVCPTEHNRERSSTRNNRDQYTRRSTNDRRNDNRQVWCDFCKSSTHSYESCRNKLTNVSDSVKVVKGTAEEKHEEDSFHSFQFSVRVGELSGPSNRNALLVDSGSTKHILNDESKFISFDDEEVTEKHCVELANGVKVNNVSQRQGTAKVNIRDSNGNVRSTTLHKVLYAPSFPYNIFSVKSATKNGASVTLGSEKGVLRSKNGTDFPITSLGDLYFLNLERNSNNSDAAYFVRSTEPKIINKPTVSSSITFSTKFFATSKPYRREKH